LKKLWRRLKQFLAKPFAMICKRIFSVGAKPCRDGYDADYVKFVGFQLWQTLSNALEVKLQEQLSLNSEAINRNKKNPT